MNVSLSHNSGNIFLNYPNDASCTCLCVILMLSLHLLSLKFLSALFPPGRCAPQSVWSPPVMCPDISFDVLSQSAATALTSLAAPRLYFSRALTSLCDRGQAEEGGRGEPDFGCKGWMIIMIMWYSIDPCWKIFFPLVPFYDSYRRQRCNALLKDTSEG